MHQNPENQKMMTTVLSLLTMVRIDYHAASEATVPCIFLIQPSKILPKLAKPNNCKQNPFVSDKDRGALSCQFRSHFFHTFPNNGLTSQTCLVYVSENYKKNLVNQGIDNILCVLQVIRKYYYFAKLQTIHPMC